MVVFWRRKRDSNPRGFWPNGFQDRLVMTASIFLHIAPINKLSGSIERPHKFVGSLEPPRKARRFFEVNTSCFFHQIPVVLSQRKLCDSSKIYLTEIITIIHQIERFVKN